VSGDRSGELLSNIADDSRLMLLIADLMITLREELGDSPERWAGAQSIVDLIMPAFVDHFGHDIIYHKRQPPSPVMVRSFGYIMAVMEAVVEDGPPS
jgi:hypothetical protein